MKPLPEVTYLTPGEDLNTNVTISASITDEDEVIVSLGHSFRGVYQDLTEYLVYKVSQEDETDKEEGSMWEINMTLPYPHSQVSGDLTLSVGDNRSGDVTTTRLEFIHEGNELAPFFDPLPKSVSTYHGQDVLINTRARGSPPLNVNNSHCFDFYIIIVQMLSLLRFIYFKENNPAYMCKENNVFLNHVLKNLLFNIN